MSKWKYGQLLVEIDKDGEEQVMKNQKNDL
jgi:hypothetical protein